MSVTGRLLGELDFRTKVKIILEENGIGLTRPSYSPTADEVVLMEIVTDQAAGKQTAFKYDLIAPNGDLANKLAKVLKDTGLAEVLGIDASRATVTGQGINTFHGKERKYETMDAKGYSQSAGDLDRLLEKLIAKESAVKTLNAISEGMAAEARGPYTARAAESRRSGAVDTGTPG